MLILHLIQLVIGMWILGIILKVVANVFGFSLLFLSDTIFGQKLIKITKTIMYFFMFLLIYFIFISKF